MTSGDGQTAERDLSISVGGLGLQPSERCSDHPGSAIATFADVGLESLVLAEQTSVDLTALGEVTWLKRLDLRGTDSVDITPLSSLTNLEWLDLTGLSAPDLEPLTSLAGLDTLRLRGADVADYGALAGLRDLISTATPSPISLPSQA